MRQGANSDDDGFIDISSMNAAGRDFRTKR